jgi:hypothetical protein
MCLLYFHSLATQAFLWCLRHLPFGTRYIHHASSSLSVETVIWLILKLVPIVEVFCSRVTIVGSGRSTRSNSWSIPGLLLDAWWEIAERQDTRLTSYTFPGKTPTDYMVPPSQSLETPGEESEMTTMVSMVKAGTLSLLTISVICKTSQVWTSVVPSLRVHLSISTENLLSWFEVVSFPHTQVPFTCFAVALLHHSLITFLKSYAATLSSSS